MATHNTIASSSRNYLRRLNNTNMPMKLYRVSYSMNEYGSQLVAAQDENSATDMVDGSDIDNWECGDYEYNQIEELEPSEAIRAIHNGWIPDIEEEEKERMIEYYVNEDRRRVILDATRERDRSKEPGYFLTN
jgi:hypothetical protein